MSDVVYTARARIDQVARFERLAHVATDASAPMGVHGPMREFYRLETPRERPLPVDWIVAATGG